MNKTRVSFCLPFELVDEGEYSVSLDGRVATIKVSVISRSKEDFEKVTGMTYETSGSGSVRITPDIHGVSVISEIHVEVPYYVDMENCVSEVLRYLNRLVDVWRFATIKFWIPYVSDRDIFTVNWETIDDSGKGKRGFMFGSASPSIIYSLKTCEANKVMDTIKELLSNEMKIPTYEILRLNARNHLVNGEYNLAVIEMNTALEVLVATFLAIKLREQRLSKEEIDNRLRKYLSDYSLHKLLDKVLREVNGRSLKDSDLWDDFEMARLARKNVIHPWVKVLRREDSEKVLLSIEQIMRWILQKN